MKDRVAQYIEFIPIIIFWIVVIVAIGYYFYHNHQNQIVQQQRTADQDRKDLIIEEANKKYTQTIAPICDKRVQDITGVDFYRCENINDSYYYLPPMSIDMKSDLADPNIPVFCKRKIAELTANEFIECLNEPQPTDTPIPDNSNQ